MSNSLRNYWTNPFWNFNSAIVSARTVFGDPFSILMVSLEESEAKEFVVLTARLHIRTSTSDNSFIHEVLTTGHHGLAWEGLAHFR